MTAIQQLVDAKRAEVEALRQKLRDEEKTLNGLQAALSAIKGEVAIVRKRRSNVKQTVLDILNQRAEEGVDAFIVLQLAQEWFGIELNRGSVSSLLSRLTSDGAVHYDGQLYRLKKYAPPPKGDRHQ